MFSLSLALSWLVPILLSIRNLHAQYVPPGAFVEPLKPVGIRISIPHEEGISLVAFHVKFNEDFFGLEAGTIARDIVKQKNGRWTYEDRSTKLNKGDIVYYWIHVVYNKLGYNLIDQQYRVIDFYNYNGEKIETFYDNNNNNNNNNDQTCPSSITKVFDSTGASRYPCSGQLLFEDNFQSLPQFRKKEWTVIEQFSDAPDYEFVVYRDSQKNIKIENGLKITPSLLKDEYGDHFIREGNLTLEKCTGRLRTFDCYREARSWNILPPISSARINTKKSVNFEYGRIEIRAKFPRGDWIYPLLMLEPVRNFEGSPLATLQIRIASAVGNSHLRSKNGNDISGHILWGGVTGLDPSKHEDRLDNNKITKHNSELWSEIFHIYELLWKPNRITLKVDGQEYDDHQLNLPKDTPFYLTLGLAVGGLSEFPDDCISTGYRKPWRNIQAKALYNFYNTTDTWNRSWRSTTTSLEVDYVKIYSL